MKQPAIAMKYYKKALNTAIKTNDKTLLQAMYSMGDVYMSQKKYDISLKYFIKALKYSYEIKGGVPINYPSQSWCSLLPGFPGCYLV